MLDQEGAPAIPDGNHRKSAQAQGLKRCAVTREYLDRHKMIRFALLPDLPPVPDLASRAGGRGIWLKADWNVIKTALRSRSFAGSGERLKPEAVLAQMSDLFECRILESLGLARRAGHLIIGFEKVAAALEEQKPGLLCLATDCSEDRCRVLSELVTKQKYMKLFQADRLGYALGRGKTTCVFVYHGHSRQRLENDIVRFQGIRPDMVRPISGNAERDTDVRGL